MNGTHLGNLQTADAVETLEELHALKDESYGRVRYVKSEHSFFINLSDETLKKHACQRCCEK